MGVKDIGTLSSDGPVGVLPTLCQHPVASRRAPAHLETPPEWGSAHLTRTCCARASPPSLSPSPGPASRLPEHLPCSQHPWDAAHLSFVRGSNIRSGQLSFGERPLYARHCAKPVLCIPHRPSAVGVFTVPPPKAQRGVAICPESHKLEPSSRCPFNHQATSLPTVSTSVIAPGVLPTALGDKTVTLVAGMVVHLMCAKHLLPHFTFTVALGDLLPPSYR